MDKPLVVPAGLFTEKDLARAAAHVAPIMPAEPRPLLSVDRAGEVRMLPKLCLYCRHFVIDYRESQAGAGDRALTLKCNEGKYDLAGRTLSNTAHFRMYVGMAQKCDAFAIPTENRGVPSGEQFGKGGSLTMLPPKAQCSHDRLDMDGCCYGCGAHVPRS